MERLHMEWTMPAEWEPHRGMLIQWPVSDSVWCDELPRTREAFAGIAKAISRFEPVTMVTDPDCAAEAKEMLGKAANVVVFPCDDCWIRDNGPTFVKFADGDLGAVSWKFNAWGKIYPKYEKDDEIPRLLCELWGIPILHAPIVLEGGSIHTDGKGTILTTEECLLNPNRNPSLSKENLEKILLDYLGANRVIWLPMGLFADETSGHVDNLCCFVESGTVLLLWNDDVAHPDYERIRMAYAVLREHGLAVEKIMQPPRRCHKGKPLTLSYVNFAYVNGGIVMPGFGGETAAADEAARHRLEGLFPRREVVQLPTLDIVKGGGNIHCITQQIPF